MYLRQAMSIIDRADTAELLEYIDSEVPEENRLHVTALVHLIKAAHSDLRRSVDGD